MKLLFGDIFLVQCKMGKILDFKVSDYGEFYAGAGARSMAGPSLFTKERVPSRIVGNTRIDRGWSQIVKYVMNQYTDKPFIISISNKITFPIWESIGFKLYDKNTSDLSIIVKNKIESKQWKYPLYYRNATMINNL